MSNFSKRLLFWTPRVISIIFLAFLSIFALDVFDGHHGFWQALLALIIHLIPVFALIGALILAWRLEWVGAALFTVAGLLPIAWIAFMQHHIPPDARPIVILMVDGPAFLIAWLFLFNWRKRDELRAHGH